MNKYERNSLIIFAIIIAAFAFIQNAVDAAISSIPGEVKYAKIQSSMAEAEDENRLDGSSGDNQEGNSENNVNQNQTGNINQNTNKANQGNNVNQGNNANQNNANKNITNNQTKNQQNQTNKKVNIKRYKTTSGLAYFHYKGYLFFNGVRIKLPKGTRFNAESNDALGYYIGNNVRFSIVCKDVTGNVNTHIEQYNKILDAMLQLEPEQTVAYGKNTVKHRYCISEVEGKSVATHIYITGGNNKLIVIIYETPQNFNSALNRVVKEMLPTITYLK